MSNTSRDATRVLAIDPTSKGFGFAVLEGPGELIDWGVKHMRDDREHRNRRCLEKVAALIVRYQPDVLVVERADVAGCRRWPRALQLISDVIALGMAQGIRVRRVSRRGVQGCFPMAVPATKRQVAVAIEQKFPELEPYLPPVRKPWMSEDSRMGIFDAVAFGLASYECVRRKPRTLSLPLRETTFPNA